MTIKFNTRKSIISLILVLAMCSSIFMISASALSVDSTAPYISEELLAKMTKAIAEKKGVSVEEIEIEVISVQQISVDEFAALQNHNHASLRGASANMVQSSASSACCSNPNYYQHTAKVKINSGGSYCYAWEEWALATCQSCYNLEALYATGSTGTEDHRYNGVNIDGTRFCAECGKFI